MKVKLLAIVLVMVMVVTFLTGCDIITKNEERDFSQVVAKVNYNGLSAVVTKAELYESYNSYGYYYTTYYGYTIAETVDLLVESLANRQLLLMYAKSEMANKKGVSINSDIVTLLTDAEADAAVKDTNKTMQSWYDNIIKELQAEFDAANPPKEDDKEDDKEEDKKDELVPRPVRPKDAEPEFDANAPVTEKTKKFFDEGYDHGDSKFMIKALAQLKKEIADSYRSYDYYLARQHETQLLQSWQRTLSEGYVPSDELVAAEYNDYITKNKETFASDKNASYPTSITDNIGGTVYHPVKGYGYVYNILLKFSDKQTADLKAMKDSGTISAENLKKYRAELAKQIKVNVSNPKYDPEYKCEECEAAKKDDKVVCTKPECPAKPFIRKDVPASTILDEIFTSFNNIKTGVGDFANLTEFQKITAMREEAIKWVYAVNDDGGMYKAETSNGLAGGGNGYLINPEGEKSTYVEEFTKLGRDMIKLGLGTFSTDGTVDGMYCVTDFGIHIMYVSYIPYDEKSLGEDSKPLTVTDNIIPLDYVISYGIYGSKVTSDTTLREQITQKLTKAYKNDKYTEVSQKVAAENKGGVEVKKKMIKKIVKEIEG
ncbi:MAG: hypothetical protein RR033_06355 [Clostridia bacterium]